MASNYQENTDPDEHTLVLVKELRRRLENSGLASLDQPSIEFVVGRIRHREQNVEEWENAFGGGKAADKSLMWRMMAYTDDPKEAKNIAVNEKESSEKENLPKTSWSSLFATLAELNDRSANSTSLKKLLRRVSEIPEEDILRADRLFYSYAKSLCAGDSYTMQHAHEQVQAIRMLRFETDDVDEFKHLVRKCRTFDDAYAHLQNLLKKRNPYEPEQSRRGPERSLVSRENRARPEIPDIHNVKSSSVRDQRPNDYD